MEKSSFSCILWLPDTTHISWLVISFFIFKISSKKLYHPDQHTHTLTPPKSLVYSHLQSLCFIHKESGIRMWVSLRTKIFANHGYCGGAGLQCKQKGVFSSLVYVCLLCITCVPGPCEGQKRILDLLDMELQTTVSHHANAGSQTWVFCKSSQC